MTNQPLTAETTTLKNYHTTTLKEGDEQFITLSLVLKSIEKVIVELKIDTKANDKEDWDKGFNAGTNNAIKILKERK
mgnify:CR=1 FL=1